MTAATMSSSSFRLCAVSLDGSFGRQTDKDQKREQAVAIFDLLDNNTFAPVGHDGGPYRLGLALADRRLVISVTTETGAPILCHHLSLTSFRRLLKDYSLVCDSYSHAKARAAADRLEAIDMGRRAIHNEASELLRERLRSKVDIDHETARRLFTLVHVLISQNTLSSTLNISRSLALTSER
ncbi:UPF0262 family protein [Phyllobacterium zundukense]|uniref:UPF0262 family protein n=1 Tax=Phyllobacterium zundukense TaxID=1867719 RepID=A0ACD4CW61_9HYPH|nr:UPF0262 family protein [Phyllobacterium zundukense]UXN57722.1 UPF0262 family protein [Phyllobacterium zundukense]